MTEDIVFSHQHTFDRFEFESRYKFRGYMTIGLVKSGHFKVFLDFENLNSFTMRKIRKLYLPVKALKIKSELIAKEQYNISHLIIEKFSHDGIRSVTLECIADDPDCSLL